MLEFSAINQTILGIPGYFFFVGIGFVISVCVFIMLHAYKGLVVGPLLRILFVSMGFLVLFARAFGLLSAIYRDIGNGKQITWDGIQQSGIVYWGGLVGLLFSYRIGLKLLNQDTSSMDILAVSIPLFHLFARIGCFFGGCCYGKESEGVLSITYTTNVLGETVTSNLLPTQLFESVFNAALFLYLLFLYRNPNWKSKHLLYRYLFLYSIGRFILEFYRGDLIRGVVAGISFSQCVCVVVLLYVVISVNHNSKQKTEEEIL